jgi:hypothetical protein
MAKQIIMLGVGAMDSLTPFITTGLEVGAAINLYWPGGNEAIIKYRDKRAIIDGRDNRALINYRDKRVISD